MGLLLAFATCPPCYLYIAGNQGVLGVVVIWKPARCWMLRLDKITSGEGATPALASLNFLLQVTHVTFTHILFLRFILRYLVLAALGRTWKPSDRRIIAMHQEKSDFIYSLNVKHCKGSYWFRKLQKEMEESFQK